jgi:predicted dehydrogenase
LTEPYPRTIAIAGAWGYIGRKFLDAALGLGLRVAVHDPVPAPPEIDPGRIDRIERAEDFYRLRAELFHLALHPEHRHAGLDALLARSPSEPIAVLVEKPMALPERPEDCAATLRAIERSRAAVLYDFPELFDPMTRRIVDFLGGFRRARIEAVRLERSKDREDPADPRNYKHMVSIPFQESVHCLAFALHLLGRLGGGLAGALGGGLRARAAAQPYEPPNPEAYPRVVEGRVDYRLALGETLVEGKTDFKRGAEPTKRRTIVGTGDGRPFRIEAEYLEGRKRLVIDGRPHDDVTATNSYAEVIKTFGAWLRERSRDELLAGPYPNPAMAHAAYRLSGVLWRSSFHGETVSLGSLDDLLSFDSGYAEALPHLPRYG